MKNAQLSENRPFVGREQELSTLLQLYDQISPHWPLVVLLYGPSGVGKSSLMREFLQRLGRRTPETVLISTTCPEWKVEPFTALHGLLQTLSDLLQGMTKDKGLALLPQHYELLHNFFPQFNQVEIFKGKDEIRYQYSPRELLNMSCTALRSLLASILKTYRFVMTINEIQWIDADSLKVLRTILQPPHAPPLCLLGSISTLEGDGDPEPLVAKIADQLPLVVRKISVTPLPPEEAGLVASNSLSNIEEMHSKIDAVTNIVRCSKGHPLLIEEMGIRIGNLKVQLDLAKFLDRLTLAETLWTRICALEEKKQNLVEVVGLCGVPVIKNVLKHFLGMEGDNLARSIDELFHERLLRPTRFLGEEAVEPYHNWVRRTIMANMSVEKQHLTHQALANAYERLKTCLPGILSWHYGYSHDFRAAGQFAAQAAERAYAALAYDLAVDFFRKAIEALAGDNEFRRKLQRRLAEALIGSFRSREAAQAYLSAVPGAAPLEALSLQKLACDQLLFCGQVSEAFHLIQELLITLGINLPKSAKGTLFSLLIRRVRIRLGGLNFHICTNESELPPQDLIQADICYSMGLVLSIIDHIAGADFNSRFFLLALKLGEPHRVLSALAVEANFIASAGKTDSRYYQKIVAKTEDLLKTHDEPNALAYLTFAEALSSYMAGEWPRAQKNCRSGRKNDEFLL